ncbi:MAG: YcfL family protein [Cephaloticoccus sp.]|nr:YcfL family protein [Cephaloticoccus sp.]
MKSLRNLGLVVMLGFVLAGCGTMPTTSRDETPAGEAIGPTEETFVTLNPAARAAVEAAAFFTRTLPDGRLEVAVNLRNRGEQPLRLKTNCVFKDEQGFSIKDETPFRTIEVAAGAIETVRFTATNPAAKRYTVRVGTAR